MAMLSGILPEEKPGAAAAYADTSPGSIFFDPEIDGVPSCAALEYMAQAMAAAAGRSRLRAGLAPAAGFLLGTRKMDIRTDRFARGRRYLVRAECTYSDGGFASFDCSIEDEDGATAAAAALTAYMPPDAASTEVRG